MLSTLSGGKVISFLLKDATASPPYVGFKTKDKCQGHGSTDWSCNINIIK